MKKIEIHTFSELIAKGNTRKKDVFVNLFKRAELGKVLRRPIEGLVAYHQGL